MTIFHFFLLIFGTIGLTQIVNRSYILSPFRKWAKTKNIHIFKLLKCSQCFGFWASLINIALIYFGLEIITFAFVGSFICYLTHLLMQPLFDKHDSDIQE